MKKRFRISRLLIIFLLISSIVAACSDKNKKTAAEESGSLESLSITENLPQQKPSGARRIKVRNIGPLSKVFNDSNYLQLEAARRLGIDPIQDLNSAYFMKRPIVKISDTEYYHIDTLKHSLPYLVPEAATLMKDIGKNFNDSLKNRGGRDNYIKVTSLLRTPESVGRLRRVNINATDSSTHQFGTTFDISYVKFYCPDPQYAVHEGDLKNLLAEVLLDLKNQGRCFVKYEYKTGCFHITVAE